MCDRTWQSRWAAIRAGNVVLMSASAVFAFIGYLAGAEGAFKPALDSTPLARVGFALSRHQLEGKPEDWRSLVHDVDRVRSQLPERERLVFELVVALRGLQHRGAPEWEKAERLCTSLGWPRCDHEALTSIARRSTP